MARRVIRVALTVVLGTAMILAGLQHFRTPGFYLRIMPPWLPAHATFVFASGIVESALGLGVLVPQTRRLAALGLIATLVAIFPANIYMATSSLTAHPAVPEASPALAWGRLPLQFVFIYWAWWVAKQHRAPRR